ncbi:MAG: 1-acyl-sn-glycerol-3-phosphate acyltransferase [Bacteroidales bacterium]|nr:1-acyl-sn-glycerol-3-phosphate acyltransferase [Bacteroidales bacterium]
MRNTRLLYSQPVVERFAIRVALVGGVLGTAVAGILTRIGSVWDPAHKFSQPGSITEFVLGWLLGAVLAGWVIRHPFRVSGLIPLAAFFWMAATGYGMVTGTWIGWLLGIPAGGIVVAALRFLRAYGSQLPIPEILAVVVAVALLPVLSRWHGQPEEIIRIFGPVLFVLTGTITAAAGVFLRRPLVELVLEPPMRLAYRYRTAGPGVHQIPRTNPCIIIANHGAYLDPLFLAGVAPRPITPMMTSSFYDKPIIRQLMLYVFDTIRVPDVAMKRDTLEITEAIAALDAGKCLVIFPEGWLRRKEEQPLRRFGRGIWQILAARPDTPVISCWIEGGWGSYLSFHNGPPTRNKRPDFRHPITVSVAEPERVPAEVLADHMATRRFLMERVLLARRLLGLPDFSLPEEPSPDTPTSEVTHTDTP